MFSVGALIWRCYIFVMGVDRLDACSKLAMSFTGVLPTNRGPSNCIVSLSKSTARTSSSCRQRRAFLSLLLSLLSAFQVWESHGASGTRRSRYRTRVELGYAKSFPEIACALDTTKPGRRFVTTHLSPSHQSPWRPRQLLSVDNPKPAAPPKVSRYI